MSYLVGKDLLRTLRDVVTRTNGLRVPTENALSVKFTGTDLKGDPHINSKIHVWKKQYACLKSVLGVSGIGLNSSTYHIDALPEVWDVYVKAYPTARGMKNKTFLFYQDWIDIFRNDRANGNEFQFYSDALNDVNKHAAKKKNSSTGFEQAGETPMHTEFTTSEFASFNQGESSSTTKDKSKVLKRKQIDGLTLQFIDTMGTISDKNDSRFGQIADTMGSIAQRIGSEFEAGKKCGQVYDTLRMIESLTVEARVEVAEYLCNNSKDMDLFYSLPDDTKKVYIKRIMRKFGYGV
ncbi:hypothetical protein ACS0TY_029601 [Phlomoides rotata]